MTSGQHNEYFWVESASLTLRALVGDIPELVMGHRVAITSFDSGPFNPTSAELREGWEVGDGIALSPPITSVNQLPTEGYDEWYVNPTWPTGHELYVLINYGGFSLANPLALAERGEPTWDRVAAESEQDRILGLQSAFWRQLEVLCPLSYVAEGDMLTCVTLDEVLFRRCSDWFRTNSG